MRFQDITDVLCLSWVQFVIYVNSQTTCLPGWFGSQCKYKCRCAHSSCDVNGKCTGNVPCNVGWFGPSCQYADLAYRTQGQRDILDGNDASCLIGDDTSTQISLNETLAFSWLRVKVAAAGAASLQDLSVNYSLGTTAVTCYFRKKQLVNSRTLDVHCDLTLFIDTIDLAGQSVRHLCSVHVSGGRNVALKAWTFQDTTDVQLVGGVNLRFPSDKAVDGNTDGHFYNSLSCSRTSSQRAPSFPLPTWIVRLSREFAVSRYAIHNRGDGEANLLTGFRLYSFDSQNNSKFAFNNTETGAKQVYRIHHMPIPIRAVVVMATNLNGILALCEVQVYGESMCDGRHYGRDCELTCNCPYDEDCFVATGGCPLGCLAGFEGPDCLSKCLPGRFGDHCNSTCSRHCESPGLTDRPLCDHVTGVCSLGCTIGYRGPKCDKECPVGTFGENCTSLCSQRCANFTDANKSSCKTTTGSCSNGCKSGFHGDTCENTCGVGKYGKNCNSSCSLSCVPSSNATISPCSHTTGACVMGCRSGLTGTRCENRAVKEASKQPAIIGVGLCLVVAVGLLVACYSLKRVKTKPAEERRVVLGQTDSKDTGR